MAHFLYFDADDIAHLIKKEIKDGMVEFDDKVFPINRKFKLLKTAMGHSPLYFLRWDTTNNGELVQQDVKFEENKDIDPETLKKLISLKILGNMLKIRKPPVSWIVMLILGLAFGGFVAYYLIAMGFIKI